MSGPAPDGTRRRLGVCYYPEQWPEERWADDARRMAAAGLSLVRIGEFGWSRMEPEPGRLEFGWLDRAVATLAAAGLGIVMGTPTATPPRWMLTRWPDMLALDAEGRPRRFGSRRHYCFSHHGYREECARIVEILAARYGRHPAVVAWQTDNEYGCHDTTVSYSEAAAHGFHDWLEARYGSVETLNASWGNVFWSMDYRRFAEIDPPAMTVTEANPAHRLDWRRYASEQVARFDRVQTAILRRLSPGRAILHNYMGRVTDFDHFAVAAAHDAASWDSYPLGFLEDRVEADPAWKRRFMRQGDPDFQAFHHDLYRAVGRGRWWVMEQQPGPVNWAPYNPDPLPGMVRLWSWEAFAHGAEVVSYFRWRQAPMAQEQMHAGLLRPDSAAAPGLDEAAAVARELAGAPAAGAAPGDCALVFDYESCWGWETQPQGRAFDYFRLVFETYRALRRCGFSIDVIPPDADDLSGWRLVAAPAVMRWREPFLDALGRFEGVALLGPRAGAKTETMRIPDGLPPGLPRNLLDATVARVESLRRDAPVALAAGGAFRFWREKVETRAEALETTADGWPAVIAQGGLRYVAGWADPEAMARIVRDAAAAAGLSPLDLPEGLRVRRAADRVFAFNHEAEAVDLGPLAALGFSGALEAAGVAAVPPL
jgi:beta-galactosidase